MDAEQTAGAAAKALTKKSRYECKDGAKVLENKVEADQTLTLVHLEESRAAREHQGSTPHALSVPRRRSLIAGLGQDDPAQVPYSVFGPPMRCRFGACLCLFCALSVPDTVIITKLVTVNPPYGPPCVAVFLHLPPDPVSMADFGS